MGLQPSDLPQDIEALQALVLDLTSSLQSKDLEIEKLRVQIAKLRRLQFGQSSEKLDRTIEQLELTLEDHESEAGAAERTTTTPELKTEPAKPVRRPLPDHLPREEVIHDPGAHCAACGGTLRPLGEDVTEILEYVPARFKVIRHVRPKLSCRTCETITQQPMPSTPIEKGRPGPGLLAHVLVSKYADHLPLYRQSEIYEREGVDLCRSTLAGWVGKAAWLLEPLVEALGDHAMGGATLHGDDTPVPVLKPGAGKTKTGRLWAYVRDERPWGSQTPPAAFYRYSPDRKGIHPQSHLKSFTGILHADGYAGFNELYDPAKRKSPLTEVACWAHVRRKFFDFMKATKSPIAEEAVKRIGILYEIERQIKGKPPDERLRIRGQRSTPHLNELHTWMKDSLAQIPQRSELAKHIRYALNRWQALTRFAEDGHIEIDNNAAERAIRATVLGRKNWLFAGSDNGGHRAAIIYSLTETAKLNAINPQAYLTEIIARIAQHPINKIDQLLPWNIKKV